MTKYFNNYKDLQKHLEKQLEKALQDDIARMVYNIVQEYILQTVYGETPEVYDRTWEFLRALSISKVKKVGDEYQVEIFIDSDKINVYPPADGYWGKHSSIDGSSFNEQLPWVLEYGSNGKGLHPTPAHGYIAKSKKEILDNNLHIKKMIGYLKSKGINATLN